MPEWAMTFGSCLPTDALTTPGRPVLGVAQDNDKHRIIAPKDEKKPEHRLVANRGPKAEVTFKAQAGLPPITETFWPEGNCYLMNEAGDTIASFGVAPYRA